MQLMGMKLQTGLKLAVGSYLYGSRGKLYQSRCFWMVGGHDFPTNLIRLKIVQILLENKFLNQNWKKKFLICFFLISFFKKLRITNKNFQFLRFFFAFKKIDS